MKLIMAIALTVMTVQAFADGKAIYEANGCNACHGNYPGGKLQGALPIPMARNFNNKKDFIKGITVDAVAKVILTGVPATEGTKTGMMVAFPQIKEADRKELAKYIVSLMK